MYPYLGTTRRRLIPELSSEAVRMIGIGGNAEALAGLQNLYSSGDEDLREAVLEAYMIAGDVDANDLGVIETDESIAWLQGFILPAGDLSTDAIIAISLHAGDLPFEIIDQILSAST